MPSTQEQDFMHVAIDTSEHVLYTIFVEILGEASWGQGCLSCMICMQHVYSTCSKINSCDDDKDGLALLLKNLRLLFLT